MTTRTTDLVYAVASLRERQDYALALSKAGELIPRGLRDPNGHPNPGKILLVTEYGNALGIHPIVALNGIDIIEGNLTITPALMSGLVRERGHKLRVSTDGTGPGLTATAVLVRSDDPGHPFQVTWTMADAKAAGLEGKSNWKKYPRAMLKARAISEVCREGAEDVLMGAYVPEELGATVNEAGVVIDAEIVEQDHDGPNVVATMREENANRIGKPRHNERTEAPHRDAGDAAPSTKGTPPGAQRPGGSRPTSKPAAGPADTTREKTAVAAEWIGRVESTDALDALYKLHDEAANRNVLEHENVHGATVEQAFLARRAELQQAQGGEPEVVDEYTDEPELDGLPF